MSDTPRTDELLLRGACYIDPNECDSVIDFARHLERELAAERIKREAAERRLSEYKSSLEALVSAWA